MCHQIDRIVRGAPRLGPCHLGERLSVTDPLPPPCMAHLQEQGVTRKTKTVVLSGSRPFNFSCRSGGLEVRGALPEKLTPKPENG
eukprot:COSAG06_NODE_4739_length_3990_cov_5.171678_4_plen_85_part_00